MTKPPTMWDRLYPQNLNSKISVERYRGVGEKRTKEYYEKLEAGKLPIDELRSLIRFEEVQYWNGNDYGEAQQRLNDLKLLYKNRAGKEF